MDKETRSCTVAKPRSDYTLALVPCSCFVRNRAEGEAEMKVQTMQLHPLAFSDLLGVFNLSGTLPFPINDIPNCKQTENTVALLMYSYSLSRMTLQLRGGSLPARSGR
jgi:hypothetical protein